MCRYTNRKTKRQRGWSHFFGKRALGIARVHDDRANQNVSELRSWCTDIVTCWARPDPAQKHFSGSENWSQNSFFDKFEENRGRQQHNFWTKTPQVLKLSTLVIHIINKKITYCCLPSVFLKYVKNEFCDQFSEPLKCFWAESGSCAMMPSTRRCRCTNSEVSKTLWFARSSCTRAITPRRKKCHNTFLQGITVI